MVSQPGDVQERQRPALPELVAVDAFRFKVAKGRPHAADVGTLEQLFLGIVVLGLRILVQVKTGEFARPLHAPGIFRIGHAQGIKEEIALSLVHPVVSLFVLLDDHGVAVAAVVAPELPRDASKCPVGVVQQFIVAAEQVQQRPVVEALVGVVETIDAGKILCGGPHDRAVRMHVFFHHQLDGVVHEIDQTALEQGPLGHFDERNIGADCLHFSPC